MALDFSAVETGVAQGHEVKLRNEKFTLNKNSKKCWIMHSCMRNTLHFLYSAEIGLNSQMQHSEQFSIGQAGIESNSTGLYPCLLSVNLRMINGFISHRTRKKKSCLFSSHNITELVK